MKVVLNGIATFEQRKLTLGSWRRESVERSAAGVDGTVSIDLGKRSRELVQEAVFRAFNEVQLKAKVDIVRQYMDGSACWFVVQGGQQFDNLRVDSIEVEDKDYSGAGVSCVCEIRYTQLSGS